MPRARREKRHRAREAALQILYQWEIGGAEVAGAAENFFARQWPDAEPPDGGLRDFASALARDAATPRAVVINEALELARTFSTDESVGFINGMLDAIRKKIEAQAQ